MAFDFFGQTYRRSLTGCPVFLKGLLKSQLDTTIQLLLQVHITHHLLLLSVNKNILSIIPKSLWSLSCTDKRDIYLLICGILWAGIEGLVFLCIWKILCLNDGRLPVNRLKHYMLSYVITHCLLLCGIKPNCNMLEFYI